MAEDGIYEGGTNPVAEVADTAKKIVFTWTLVVKIVLVIFAAILVFWIMSWVLNAGYIPQVAEDKTSTEINLPQYVAAPLKSLLGIGNPTTGEILVIYITIFFIIIVALSEIIDVFGIFSKGTSTIIGVGLGLIAGSTGAIKSMAGWFGLTAHLGVLGILVVIGAAILVAVMFNVGLGSTMRRWRLSRQIEMDALHTEKSSARMKDAAKSLVELDKELEKLGRK